VERNRIKHKKQHEGSFSDGLAERPRHPEAEPKGRFSTGLEETGEAHEKRHEGSFSGGLEERLRHPEAEPKGRFSTGLEREEAHEKTHEQ
jgi:hypothetical protein